MNRRLAIRTLRWAALLLIPLVVGCASLCTGCSPRATFLERNVTLGEHTYHYRVYLPAHYTRLRRWPVVLFLHGSGERGNDNLRQLSSGIAPALEQHGELYHCIVVLPQCAYGQEWYGDMEVMALAELDGTIREFHGDPRRVYLTGVSMGGAGTWYMARHRRRFAAIVPIAAEVVRATDDPFPSDLPPDLQKVMSAPDPFAALAGVIRGLPTWVFHGADDSVVPVDQSRRMVAALRATGGNVRYTEYPETGHECWDEAYADPELAKWLFAQRLR